MPVLLAVVVVPNAGLALPKPRLFALPAPNPPEALNPPPLLPNRPFPVAGLLLPAPKTPVFPNPYSYRQQIVLHDGK
jgi:hypothetical protein